MTRLPSPAAASGLTLATEELLALCAALNLDPPKTVIGATHISEAELTVARHALIARKIAVPHQGTIVVHPAVSGMVIALAAPSVVIRVEVDERTTGVGDPLVVAAGESMVVEYRLSSALDLHHLSAIPPDNVIGAVMDAASVSGGPPSTTPGFAVRAGALRAALAELEHGAVAEALDALVGGGAPVRPARAFAAAVAARVRTVVVAVMWREHDVTSRSTTSWVDGGSLGLWRLTTPEHAATATVEPATRARVEVEIANALPARLAGRGPQRVVGAAAESSVRS